MGELVVGPITGKNGERLITADGGEEVPCDGRELSREEYPLLFAKIGTHYGAGDGEETFNVPDLRLPTAIDAAKAEEAEKPVEKPTPRRKVKQVDDATLAELERADDAAEPSGEPSGE